MIIPDYARPSALMVPHFRSSLSGILEEIAIAASLRIGVILLSNDPVHSREFVGRQARPQRFSIVTAPYDTPWIRDRAPIAVRDKNGQISWVLPHAIEADRPLDDRLFATICARPVQTAPLAIAHGNLVAGPGGLVLSTSRVLYENRIGTDALEILAPALGIRDWIVFDPLPNEPTAHADMHVRFLRADLMAVAWHPRDEALQQRAIDIENRVKAVRPRIRSIRMPSERFGQHYASLLNWIQIGRDLFLPAYPLVAPGTTAESTQLLTDEGFRVRLLPSPALDFGGSLHCLTASVFV